MKQSQKLIQLRDQLCSLEYIQENQIENMFINLSGPINEIKQAIKNVESSEPWKPDNYSDDEYYMVNPYRRDSPSNETWCDEPEDINAWDTGNCFRSEEQASIYKRFLETVATLYRAAYNTGDISYGWYEFSEKNGAITIEFNSDCINTGQIKFGYEAAAEEAMAKVGAENTLLYLRYYNDIGGW